VSEGNASYPKGPRFESQPGDFHGFSQFLRAGNTIMTVP